MSFARKPPQFRESPAPVSSTLVAIRPTLPLGALLGDASRRASHNPLLRPVAAEPIPTIRPKLRIRRARKAEML